MKSTDRERGGKRDAHLLSQRFLGISITSLLYLFKKPTQRFDAILKERSCQWRIAVKCQICGFGCSSEWVKLLLWYLIKATLSLSCCLAKPFELMISQFIWKRSLPGQPSMQIQFTGSYHRVVMGIFFHTEWLVSLTIIVQNTCFSSQLTEADYFHSSYERNNQRLIQLSLWRDSKKPSLRVSNTDAQFTSILSVCQQYVLAALPDGLSCCVNCLSIHRVMPIVTFGLSCCCEVKPLACQGLNLFVNVTIEGDGRESHDNSHRVIKLSAMPRKKSAIIIITYPVSHLLSCLFWLHGGWGLGGGVISKGRIWQSATECGFSLEASYSPVREMRITHIKRVKRQ